VLIILELTILAEGARTAKIGNPVQWTENSVPPNGNFNPPNQQGQRLSNGNSI